MDWRTRDVICDPAVIAWLALAHRWTGLRTIVRVTVTWVAASGMRAGWDTAYLQCVFRLIP